MGGRNEHSNLRSINKSGHWSIRKIKVQISSQSSIKCMILEPHPGTSATNKMDSNADTCCLGTNFIFIVMTETTANMYPYNMSYEHMYNVPIVTGASTYTNINTGRSFIIILNEVWYYSKKLCYSMINPNQLRSYGTMVLDNPFDSSRELSVKIQNGDTIDLIANGTKIEFYPSAPTEHEFKSLPHVNLTSKFQWNPETFQIV